MTPAEHSVDARGLKIHYVEWGEGDAPPLVLVHGFLDHARSWDAFVAALRDRLARPRRIIALDCRGHGDSGWVGAGGYYHFPDYILDLDTLIQNLSLPSVSLLGHSMGGTIAFLYAGTFPRRVEALILVEGMGPRGHSFSAAPQRMEQWITDVHLLGQRRAVQYANLEKGAERLRRNNPRLKPDMALHLARHGMRQTPRGKWVWKFDPLHRTTSPQPFYAGQAQQFFQRIQCPALILWGEESRQLTRREKKERLEGLAGETHVTIKNAGHMIHHDNPQDMARVVAAFLARPIPG